MKGGEKMCDILRKPQEKDDEHFCTNAYPEIVQNEYGRLSEKLNAADADDVSFLVDMVYKIAYVDGFRDALYFREL